MGKGKKYPRQFKKEKCPNCVYYTSYYTGRAVYPVNILPWIVPSDCTQLCACGTLRRHYIFHIRVNDIDMTDTHIYDFRPKHIKATFPYNKTTKNFDRLCSKHHRTFSLLQYGCRQSSLEAFEWNKQETNK